MSRHRPKPIPVPRIDDVLAREGGAVLYVYTRSKRKARAIARNIMVRNPRATCFEQTENEFRIACIVNGMVLTIELLQEVVIE